MDTVEIYKPHSKINKNGLYHGCYGVNEDGTRILITGKCSVCRYPTNDPFWMKAKDVNFKVKTRAQKEKSKRAKTDEILKYFTKTVPKNKYNDFEVASSEYKARCRTVTY